MAKRLRITAIFLILLTIFATACNSGGSPKQSQTNAPAETAASSDANSGKSSGEKVELTFWTWGESDIPGFDQWMQKQIDNYQTKNPNIAIHVVKQNTDTLTGAFQATAATNSGPDIATLWATIPVLTQVWGGYVAPISDYVPADEIKHWVNTSENTYEGKVWAAPIYLIGVPLAYNKDLFKQAGLDPENPPKTWDEFLKACEALKAKGITPIGMGNKDGYAGAWMFSNFGKQNLDSMEDLKQAVIGKMDITDPKYTGWYAKLAELVDKGYFNDDISSLDLNNGWKLFPSGKVAMSWTTDGNFISWLKSMGGDAHIGAMQTPIFGTGKLAESYNATQSSSYFITSWSKHKQEAADFLAYLHSKESISDFYTSTGAFPADDRFDTGLINDKEIQKLFNWDTQGTQVWPENYLPPMVDGNADIAGGQMITSKSGNPQDVVKLWDTVLKQWRSQHPDELENFKNWSK
ncbi:ABC transporter substrate-binding protein [Ferviditalea candida]|uniref:Extracellular solute-binding protein n=1 Tax=Ferviditalea candida TaxID=3108399 RepID=A0ABU5ZEL5_9BACL|nr:extracellular solute-binding protein [Paenibacillaceae bacterium T2]